MLWPWRPTAGIASSPVAASPRPAPTPQAAADPLMAMLAPLVVLVGFSYGRRYRKDGLPQGLVVLVMMVGLGLAVTSCIPIPTPTPTPTFTPTPTATPMETPTPSPTPIPEPVVLTTTIDYSYDPLYRLIAADYNSGEFFHYVYDPIGNRLRQETQKAINLYDQCYTSLLIGGLNGSAFHPTIAGTFEPATPMARHLPGPRGRLAPVPRLCAAGRSAEAWNYTSRFFSPLKPKTS